MSTSIMIGRVLWLVVGLLCLATGIKGDCLHSDALYLNNSVWQPDPCTVCTCQDPVSVCETIRCTDPKCDYRRGEQLQFPAGGCCPVCVGQMQPCQLSGQSVPHNTDWTQSQCETCFCDDGDITCTNQTCPRTRCRPGEVSQKLPGQCCPKCIPAGGSCTGSTGTRYPDGSEWSPLACTKCVCRDGQTTCYPRQCAPLVCPQGEVLSTSDDGCCPACVSQQCQDAGNTYQSGAQWRRDPCTFCTCMSGAVVCHAQQCADDVTCRSNERKIRRPGQCCPECVPKKGQCRTTDLDYYHDDMWTTGDCEYCACSNGNVNCRTASCERVVCSGDEVLQQVPGQCCPQCISPKYCQLDGDKYLDGEMWQPGPCTVCNCVEGETVCYQQSCPVCPSGSYMSIPPGQCCGTCQKVECSEACSHCLPDDPQHCTGCKEFGKLAQDGLCVDQCKDGYYPTRDNKCKACGESCETCVDETEYHCVTCHPGQLWRDGQCVGQCGAGHFLRNGQCLACHSSCETCTGSGRSQCVSCAYPGHVLLRGRCTDTCGSHYYIKDGECHACPPYCRTCLPDSPGCATCHAGYSLHQGTCLGACPRGYFKQDDTCTECHPGCLTCDDGGERQCQSCAPGYQLQSRACLATCPPGQYLDSRGQCQGCESGCEMCHPGEEGEGSVCSRCAGGLTPAGSGCVSDCPLGTYLSLGICKACDSNCARCEGPSSCLSCTAPFVLDRGVCVSHCGQRNFISQGQQCADCERHCLRCSAADTCELCDSRTYLRAGMCVGLCGQGYVTDMDNRMCIANQQPPTLTILGAVQTSDSGITPVPPSLVYLQDQDTPGRLLQVLVMRPPSGGHLVRTSQGRDEVLGMEDTFSLQDLQDKRIRYISGRDGRTSDTAVLKASDGSLFSEEVSLRFLSLPASSLNMRLNKPLQVIGGGTAVLNREVLDFESSGDINSVKLKLVEGPLEGQLLDRRTESQVKEFTLRDLRTGAIAYQHFSNSSAPSDMMVLQVSDNFNVLNNIISVIIRAENSRLPVVINNRGGQVVGKELMQLTKELLQAQAMDTENIRTGDLIYTLTPSVNNPKHGEIVMLVPIPAGGAGRGWQDVGDGMMAAKMYRFLQRDIDEGRIWYRHLKDGTTSDVFTFEVADTASPANILKDQSFHVNVIDESVVDELSEPTLAPGIKLGMTVLENQIVPLRPENLLYEDKDTSPADIVYAITTLLGEGEGMLEHVDAPFQPVLRFSQEDINSNHIVYRPPDADIGLKEKDVTFSFVVTDGGRERKLPEQKFTIRILPVDNAAPKFRVPNAELTVAQGGVVPVSTAIEVTDADTKMDALLVHIEQAPSLGRLEREADGVKVTLRTGDSFYYGEPQSMSFQYIHGGSESPLVDVFDISASDDKHKTTSTVKINILKVDKAAPFMLASASCHVNVTEGGSVTITRKDLAFGDSDEIDEGIFIILSSETAQGRLLRNGVPLRIGEGFSQDDINQGRLSYKSSEEIGSRPLTELVYFNVTDSSRNLLPSQVLSVRIKPSDNQPPVVSVGPDLPVEEGSRVAITGDSIKVLDIDSAFTSLLVTVDVPPSFGQILNTKPEPGSETSSEKVVTSFTVQDLVDGFVYYNQQDHKHKEPAWDNFLFYVSDGVNVSPQSRFNISINLVNDEQPYIITEQLFVQEGKAVTLTNASMYVIDIDTAPQDLLFTVQIPPSHGALRVKELPIEQAFNAVPLTDGAVFTYEDILNELIVYTHDNSEAMTDMFSLHLSDGDFNDTKNLNVIIGLINDETPRMTINRGLRIQSGSTTPIQSQLLKATDVDSDDSTIIYTVRRDPTAGHLLYRKMGTQFELSAHGRAKSFTQDDIDKGYIWYSHEPGETTGNILFKFKLSDPEGNELIDQDFHITVLEDRLPPLEEANKELIVREGGRKKITTEYLSFTDADSEPGSLKYTVFLGPTQGHLELTGQPGVPVTEFTQSEVAAQSLVYIHSSREEMYMDKFSFSVTDGANTIVKTFYISISPVDDELPRVVSRGLQVQEGVRKLITEFDLKATDTDTKEDHVMFKIVQPPVHGTVDVEKKETFQSADEFSMEDIYENRVSYKHDGSETLEDNFSFVVSDGTNSKFIMQQDEGRTSGPVITPQEFDINVLPMDDGSPILATNVGLQFLELSGTEISNLITERELKSTDEDSLEENIVYVIKKHPKHGRLEYTNNPGGALGSFTQDDVNNGRVRYILTDGTASQDSFTFDLMDAKPNVVPGNIFHIMWSVISFGTPLMNISETEGVIQVPVIRTGNLKQYSIVTCKSSPGSATSLMAGAKPGHKDFIEHAGQVQFDEWQDSKTCTIIINDDSVYEGLETFYIELINPTYALLGDTPKMAVTIIDTEDEPTIEFEKGLYHVNESDAYVMAVIKRTGDLGSTVSVICYTTSLTATGSSLTSLESGSDYISRGRTNSYRVVFPAGVTEATCDVKILDDSESETSEQFEIGLMEPSIPASLGAITKANVVIEGPNDESIVYLSEAFYSFPEDSGNVEVEVERDGADLSHSTTVWCATRLSSPPSATPGQDYVPSSSQITFGPGQIAQQCQLTLLDDDFDPRLEGNETFVVFLSSAIGSSLAEPYISTVTITDKKLDMPRLTFVQDHYYVDEKNRTVNVTIMRTGDLNSEVSVICYTRQKTAQVMMDYSERTLNNASRISFKSGDRMKNCTVGIVDDDRFEPEEDFLLKLSDVMGSKECHAELGDMVETTVTITNHDDVPTIQFGEAAYSVHEPSASEQISSVLIKVVRTGDLNQTSSVRCSTRDGSAQSGMDYNPKSLLLKFPPGVNEIDFVVDVLYNSDIEWHESFTLLLGPEDPEGAVFGSVKMTTVTILDNEVSGSIILPAPPVVVSLLNYDDAETGSQIDPSPGYPLVCVTPCDEHYPTFTKTHMLCAESKINQSTILYRWEVALPEEDDGSRPPFMQVSDQTLFTSVDRIVLDSIYFRSRFQVRCVAQPIHENGNPGVPLKSRPVTIGTDNGLCKSPAFGSNPYSYQAQSFLANLDYVDADDFDHPNTIHISVEIPHQDGMLPLISTFPLHNLRFLLAEPIYRQQHVCSNIITAEERKPLIDQGFFDGDLGDSLPFGPGHEFPYQFEDGLREEKTLSLYKHLNLKSCIWTFDAWYHMTELVDICGGRIVSDFQVKDTGQSHLTVRVPLYVSYLYATAPIGWGSLEHRTEMDFSFYYDTMLWKTGLETEGSLGGKLQILRIQIGSDGKLVIDFRTTAKFRGQYVLSHNTLPEMKSRVKSPSSLGIAFDLELLWSQQTFDSPHQLWRATSSFNLKDYTGLYTIDLIPCSVKATQKYVHIDPIPCIAAQPQRFEVPISFQQTNRPVPVVYSLNTDFQLTNNQKMFLINPNSSAVSDDDWAFNGAFSPGQRLYGRVLWSPDQDLKTAYKLAIEKVYLCTGSDGYIPTYDPTGEEYNEGPQFGCIQPSSNLQHRFLILDRGNPDAAQTDFHDVLFDAELAYENPDYKNLVNMPGVDGFSMSIDPLYKVTSGHQWYLQVIYVIGPSDKLRRRFRRSTIHQVSKRAAANDFSTPRNGTNMKILHLNPYSDTSTKQSSFPDTLHIAIPVALCGFIIIIVALIVIIVAVRRRRRKKDPPVKPNNLVTVVDASDATITTNRWKGSRRSLRLSDSRRNLNTIEEKSNIVKAKEVNLKVLHGNNVDSGTEV